MIQIPKNWVLANLRNLVSLIDLILHILIVPYVFQHEVMLVHITIRGWREGGLVGILLVILGSKLQSLFIMGGH